MTGDKYLEILKNQIFSQLQQLPNLHNFYFQQDGVPPHYSKGVCEYLDETFSLTWIGRRGSINWPARSPDLTPMDFFFWGVLKDKVYSQKPRSDLCKNVCRSIRDRLQSCVNQEGKQFEHLR